MNLHNKIFKAESKAETGEVGSETRFHYYQEGGIIWADYAGGDIKRGQIIGRKLDELHFEIRYQHINQKGELRTGTCQTEIVYLPHGKMQLNESWQWTSGDGSSGTSILVEI